jgi:DNA (cytosine-5)-methyltransferase 1
VRIGSLFSGYGGLDLAAEWALGGRTAWQLDLVGADIRRRHWPDATQITADVADVDPLSLPSVDCIVGGFSCKGVSVAGPGTLLQHPETRATYYGLLRFVAALRPDVIVIENTPQMLTALRATMEADYGALGYGLTWVRARASDVGAPHIRARVFAVGQIGRLHGPVLTLPPAGSDARPWATVKGSDARSPRPATNRGARQGSDGLACEVRPWPTVTQRGNENVQGLSLWGSRLNPDWVECLMGLPMGWTLPAGDRLIASEAVAWPRGRYPEDGDRSVEWPGYDWEPRRTIPDGPPVRGRAARIERLGNGVVPQQGAAAIRLGMDSAQRGMF